MMLFFSTCAICHAKLLMGGKKKFESYSCSSCIAKNSALRNDRDETYKYEIYRFKKEEEKITS